MQDEETSVLSALRREPELTSMLFKVSAVTAIGLVAWDVLGTLVLPDILVKAVMVLILLGYGAVTTQLVVRIMASSRSWASSSATTASKLAKPGGERRTSSSGIDLQSLRRRPDQLPRLTEEEEEDAPVERR